MVVIEYIKSKEDLRLPLSPKLRQAVFYLVDLLIEQPGRMYAFALVICRSTAYLMMLTREELSIAEVVDCWAGGIAELSVQVYFLLHLDLSSAGFAPFIPYRRIPNRAVQPFTFSPAFASLLPPHLRQLKLVVLCRPLARHTPHSRATTVYEVTTINGRRFIIKLQCVSDDR